MRFVFLFFSVGIFLITLFISCMSYLSIHTNEKYLTHTHVPIYVLNTSGANVPTFKSSNPKSKLKEELKPGGYYLYSYSGTRGDWLYGEKVLIKDKHRRKAILIMGYPIRLDYLQYSFSVGVILFLVSLIMAALYTKKEMRPLKSLNKNLLNERKKTTQLTEEVKDRNRALENLKEEFFSLNKENTILKSVYQERIERFKYKEGRLKERFELEASRFRKEIERKSSIKIKELSDSYERLNDAYEHLNNQYTELEVDFKKIKKQGLVFDIDFDKKTYQSLLKGRLFEIYFAKNLLKDPKFEILAWTSDKGFENGLHVQSNGDPDFLIQYEKQTKLAIECKYRTKNYGDAKEPSVDWGYISQSKRYLEYQKNDIPVYLVIGVGGEAESPNALYFGSILKLKEISTPTRWRNDPSKQVQNVVKYEKISNMKIIGAENIACSVKNVME